MAGLVLIMQITKNCLSCEKEYKTKPSRANKSNYCSNPCRYAAQKHNFLGASNPNWKGGLREKTCTLCGRVFHTYPSLVDKHIYCSRECADKALLKNIKYCKHCGGLLPRSNALADSDFCSKECRKVYIRQAKINKGMLANCIICGASIGTKNMTPNRKYCSWECCLAARTSKIIRYCRACRQQFEDYPERNKKYCSRECYNRAISLRQRGSNSHFWKGGKTQGRARMRQHPLYREWRRSVFERDNYTCQECQVRGGRLAAHHVVPVSVNPRKALRVSNGLTLCWECHKSAHRDEG